MNDKIGTLSDRIANRLVRHFPRRTVAINPQTPIVSFTFDDAPESAWRHGADTVEAHGGRATYYIAGALAGQPIHTERYIDADGCADLAARGHELASHTFAHRKLANYSAQALEEDLRRNETYLAQFDGRTAPRNFAVPFTMASPFSQPILRQWFLSSRGGHMGINRGVVDPHYLCGKELRPETPRAEIATLYDDLEEKPGWLLIFTHDLSENPSRFGYDRAGFAALVGEAASRGFIIASVDDALGRLGVRDSLIAATRP